MPSFYGFNMLTNLYSCSINAASLCLNVKNVRNYLYSGNLNSAKVLSFDNLKQ